MTAVLAVDPGKCTGFLNNIPDRYEQSQLPAMEFCDRAAVLAEANREELTIVCEMFVITQATLRKAREPDALHVIGVLRWLAHQYGCAMAMQKPADAKNFCSDERLKKLGLYTPGEEHARDAARHYVVYAVKNGLIDPELL